MSVRVCVCALFLISESLKFPRGIVGGDLLSENKISSCIIYNTCFAACISGPLDVPKGVHTTPTVTTVVQIKQSIFDLSLAKYCLKQVSVFCKILLFKVRQRVTKTIFRKWKNITFFQA